MNDPAPDPVHALLVIRIDEDPPLRLALEEAARLADTHVDRVRHYCRIGLFGPALARESPEPVFDSDRLYELRRLEHFRQHHGVNHETLRLLAGLWRELDQLRAEVAYLRAR